jgi:hypothetical protein
VVRDLWKIQPTASHCAWFRVCFSTRNEGGEQVSRERLIRIIAGSFVLLSLALAWAFDDVRLFDGPTWLWFTAFVGANLLQSGFTRWCLMEDILARLGVGTESGAAG